MSAPNRGLQNLNLDEMPVTRSHTRSSREGRGGKQTHSGSHRMNPLAHSTPSVSPHYTAEPSRRGSRAPQEPSHQMPRAPEVSPIGFKVVRVNKDSFVEFFLIPATKSATGRRPFAQSQLPLAMTSTEQAIVRIDFDPARGDHRASCDWVHHGQSDSICSHIFWLIGRLHQVLLNPHKMRQTDQSNIKQQIGQLYRSIQNMTGDALLSCANSSRSVAPEDEEESEDDDTEAGESSRAISSSNPPFPSASQEHSLRDRQNRRIDLSDILTSFDEDTTPERFLRKVDSIALTITSPTNDLVEDNLPATMFRLAMRDDYIYRALQRLVPSETRAIKYYQTQLSIAEETLQACSTRSSSPMPVPQCATKLRKIVHDLFEDRPVRHRQSSPRAHDAIDENLAECLVVLVRKVVNERHSHYRNMAGAPPRQRARNIYDYLISDLPASTSGLQGWRKDLFVVDRYGVIPNSQWSATREEWESIKRDVETTPGGVDATDYADRIGEMLRGLNNSSDPSENAQTWRMPRA